MKNLQTFKDYEIIWVDDHSGESLLDKNKEGIYIELGTDSEGKKAAIRSAVSAASYPRIVTLDADILLSDEVLIQLALWESDAMIIPVITEGNAWVEAESYGLAGLTVGTAKMKRALMANGACLAFKKSVYENLVMSGESYASGDDMFLLEALKRNSCRIDTIRDKNAFVVTRAPKNTKAFIDQRVRWASKSTAIKDMDMLVFGLFTFAYNLGLLIALTFSIYSNSALLFVGIFAFKSIIDISLLFLVASRFRRKQYPTIYLLMTVVYPIYVVLMLLVSLLYRPKWKGRNLKHV